MALTNSTLTASAPSDLLIDSLLLSICPSTLFVCDPKNSRTGCYARDVHKNPTL